MPAGLQSNWERRRQAWEGWRQAWEHLGAPATNLAAPATCLGAPRITVMYSVCILIYVSMYLCIYIATHLHTLYLDWLQAVHESNSRFSWKMTIEWTQRYTPRRCSSGIGDALGGCDRVNLEMHSEIVIAQVWRCTWRPCLCELAGCNRASLEILLEAVIERV